MAVGSGGGAVTTFTGVGDSRVALTEAWHFMYDHLEATPAELRQEVVRVARDPVEPVLEPVLGMTAAAWGFTRT